MTAIVGVVTGLAGLVGGYLIRLIIGRQAANTAETQAEMLLRNARREAEAVRKEAKIQAKEQVIQAMEEFEKTSKSRRKELSALEERITQRESNLDRKVALLDKKEHTLDEKLSGVEQRAAQLEREREKIDQLVAEEQAQLQRVAGMTREEARDTLLSTVEQDLQSEVGGMIRRMQEEAKETAEREAKKIVCLAIQRYSSVHSGETMTSTVALPGDDMKGRIIGRDGRNIRALEGATGVNVLIDDTPEAVVISGFDPIRREIAKQSLETLISDGRIHPARIEEVVAKVTENMDEMIRQAGEEAVYATSVQSVEPELLRTLGRLKFRSSYSQNVLEHAIEVSNLMGNMAGEMGLDVSLAKRIGLFHDVGKALDHEIEGGHAVIGADLLKRHGEGQVVINAVAAHHEEVEPESLYAILCSAADAISSSRVGARSETTDIYLKRLEKLENLANSFDGVTKSYAIHAGREVRVLVEPEEIDDSSAMVMARNISKKIESDLQYPGQIRVTVIRERRCVEYAR